MPTKRQTKYEISSGNVFEDLDLPDPEISQMKTRIALEIQRLVNEQKLTQARVAEITKLTQPNVSALMNLKLQGFSLERLIETATRLGSQVDLQIRVPNHVTR